MNEQNITIQKTTVNSLGTEQIGRLILRYAVPSIISIVVNSLYSMVDQIFIGQGVGYLGNAATSVIVPLVTLVMAFGILFGDGAATYMSLNLGKQEPDKAAKGAGNTIVATVVVGIITAIVCIIFLEPLCFLFGATSQNLAYALEYGRIIAFGFPVAIICAGFGSIIRADGSPKRCLIGLLIGCITNIILDPLFIFVFHWGVAGAAWATIIGQFLNAVYFVFCLFKFKTIKLSRKHFMPTTKVLLKVAAFGISSFISQLIAVVAMTVVNNLLVKYGALSKYGADIPLAAWGIANKASTIILGIALGIAGGVQPILGYNYGSGQYDRVKKTFKIALISGTMILVLALFIFQVFPEQIVLLFGQESELYMEFAIKCFRILLAGCFMIASAAVSSCLFQSIGKPVFAAILAMSRQFLILIPSVFLFSYIWGVDVILVACAFSDILAGIVSLIVVKVRWNKIFEKGSENAYSSVTKNL